MTPRATIIILGSVLVLTRGRLVPVAAAEGDGVRVIVRPSGTEPKLKAYLETVVPVHDDAGLIAARGRGEDELDQLRAEMSAALGL